MNKVCVYCESFSPLEKHQNDLVQYLLTVYDEVWLIPKNDNYDISIIDHSDQRIKLKKFDFKNNSDFSVVTETINMYNIDSKIVNRLYFLIMSSQLYVIDREQLWDKYNFAVVMNTEEKINIKKPHMLLNNFY